MSSELDGSGRKVNVNEECVDWHSRRTSNTRDTARTGQSERAIVSRVRARGSRFGYTMQSHVGSISCSSDRSGCVCTTYSVQNYTLSAFHHPCVVALCKSAAESMIAGIGISHFSFKVDADRQFLFLVALRSSNDLTTDTCRLFSSL